MTLMNRPGLLNRSAVPRYRQIEAILRDQIFNGELAAGDKVPTEEELGRMFEVSRPTVRQALQALEQDGLIFREAGRGTFVNAVHEEPPAERRTIWLDELVDTEIAGRIDIQRSGTVAARGLVQSALGIPYGEEVLYFVRIYRDKDAIFGGEKVYLPLSTGEQLTRKDMEAKRFLSNFAKLCGIEFGRVDVGVEAMLADVRTSAMFDTYPGAALTSIRRSSFDKSGTPVEHSHMLFRSDRCQVRFAKTRTGGGKLTLVGGAT